MPHTITAYRQMGCGNVVTHVQSRHCLTYVWTAVLHTVRVLHRGRFVVVQSKDSFRPSMQCADMQRMPYRRHEILHDVCHCSIDC